MDVQEAQLRFAAARVAVLATVDDRGAPHLVPVTFVVERSGPSHLLPESADSHDPAGSVVWSATDTKPKRGGALRRHTNVRAHPAVSLLVQYWDERWDALWWVRADGTARLFDDSSTVERVAGLLREKYRQYGSVAVTGPLIRVEVRAWRGWSAS